MARQESYVGGIKKFIGFYAIELRALRDMLSAYTTLHLDGAHVEEELSILNSAKEEIERSGLNDTIKISLLAYMDDLIKGIVFKPSSSP